MRAVCSRRGAIIGLLLLATAIPRAHAQQGARVYRVAIVASSGPVSDISETSNFPLSAFLRELRRLGYVEEQNLVVERYSAQNRSERYPALVGDVVRSHPDAVLIYTASLAREFKAQTTTVPIVAMVIDPVALGLVSNVARPGGNITGTYATVEISGKGLGLLREAIPKLSRVGLLVARTLVAEQLAVAFRKTSQTQGISVVGSPLESPFDESAYRQAFAALVRDGAEAVFVGDQVENWTHRQLIVELTAHHRLPAIYPDPGAVELGGLMSYGIEYKDQFRRAANIIDQILKGTKPGDIPFYQADKFSLAINLKTAKTLGLEIPASLLAQADEVIE